MPFISLAFVGYFAIVALVHFLLPLRWRWAWLLAASLVFCGWVEPIFLLQLMSATGLTYYAALRIEAEPDKERKQPILGWAVLALVANLFVFKYTSFFNETFRSLFAGLGAEYPVAPIQLPLPLGISFYTFLLIGYLVDVFRGAAAERHFGIFALFAAFFPKFVSGPIERGKNLLPQLHAPEGFDAQRVMLGLQLVLWGVFKKAVVADRIAGFVDPVYNDPGAWDGVAYISATFLYAFQVYCDFSGYTDIAIGLAIILGYRLMNNFNRPYFATSIQDFWKRWHISLTSWLTDYIYTPLTRQKTLKIKFFTMMLIGLFVTFVASGLWHGAQWTCVAWGALHGAYIVAAVMLQ
jgi:D-alanyl-lipoteichoic acid acyltransferase DltB (MBOAT superfamily)